MTQKNEMQETTRIDSLFEKVSALIEQGRLTERFGDGWSYPSMKNIRQFYLTYSKRLNTVYPIDTEKAKQRLANSGPGNDIADFVHSADEIEYRQQCRRN